MSRECIIEFRQNGNQLDLDVQARSPEHAEEFETQVARQRLDLSDADLDILRSGAPPAQVKDKVAAAVSQWLLQPNLDLPNLLKLTNNPPPRWRLVFSTEKIQDENLRQSLSQVPLELVHTLDSAIPLAVHSGVSSIVHRLPKMGTPPPVAANRNWPFRVLIVRSNPQDLGGAVPPAAPIRDAILSARPDLAVGGVGSSWIRVDVLSSETAPGVAGRPTADQLYAQVNHAYDMLIYLGHGDVQTSPTGGPSLGVLLLETEDGQNSKPVDARQLSVLLNRNPIPVVLLIACLTAAQVPAAMRPQVESAMPGWIRGSQGVAQALVSGQSGVQFVLGMRFKVANTAAERFLRAFFVHLLRTDPGNLEAALQEGRSSLHFDDAQAISWAAPVAFRTRGSEPSFPYLASNPPPITVPLDADKEKQRSDFWLMLSEINWQLRGTGFDARWRNRLDVLEKAYFDALAAQAALIVPERKEIDPNALAAGGDTEVKIAVRLRNTLVVRQLDGDVVISGARLVALEATPELEASGLDLLQQLPARDNRIKFHLQLAPSQLAPVAMQPGPILTIRIAIPNEQPAVYVIGLESLRVDPAAVHCGLANAIIVPAP